MAAAVKRGEWGAAGPAYGLSSKPQVLKVRGWLHLRVVYPAVMHAAPVAAPNCHPQDATVLKVRVLAVGSAVRKCVKWDAAAAIKNKNQAPVAHGGCGTVSPPPPPLLASTAHTWHTTRRMRNHRSAIGMLTHSKTCGRRRW